MTVTTGGSNPDPGEEGGDPGPATVPVTGVSLNLSELPLATGGTAPLTASVLPTNATNKSLTWKSSDETVATVDKNGNVTAVGPGTCTITVTTAGGGFSASCEVTVKVPIDPPSIVVEIDFSGLGLVDGVLPLKPGEAVDLRIAATPSGTTFTATGLPEGLPLTPEGRLHGSVPAVGTYTVTVTATATAPDGTTRVERFVIEVTEKGVIVTPEGGSGGGCDAGLGALTLFCGAAMVAVKRKR